MSYARFIVQVATLVLAGSLTACGPGSVEHQQLQAKAKQLETQVQQLNAEVQKLRTELEEERFGADRLLKQAMTAANEGRDTDARTALQDLLKRHPASDESQQARNLLATVEARIRTNEERAKREEEQRKQAERRAFEDSLRNIKKQVDEIEGITWMSHRNAPILGKYVVLYFGTQDEKATGFPIRLRVQYYDENWLFVRSLTIKADDRVFELPRLDFKRDNSSGHIWEWIDEAVTDHAMLRAMMDAKRVVVRFNGDTYRSDFVLPSSQQKAMKEVYAVWHSLGGTPR